MNTLSAFGLVVRLGGKTVVDGFTASFSPGQVTAIVGPNGAGKSTLLACLAGLRKPSAGVAQLGGGFSDRHAAAAAGAFDRLSAADA